MFLPKQIRFASETAKKAASAASRAEEAAKVAIDAAAKANEAANEVAKLAADARRVAHKSARSASPSLPAFRKSSRNSGDKSRRKATSNQAGGRLLAVGRGRAYSVPSKAAKDARDGDIIEIQAGTYRGEVAVWRANNLVIRGVGGRVVLDAAGQSARGKAIWLWSVVPVRVMERPSPP